MFVDTIGFEFIYDNLDKCEYILENLDLCNLSFSKYAGKEKVYRRFKVFDKNKKVLHLESYRADISCQLKKRTGKYFDFWSIYFEFSIPKFYFGTNCFSFDCDLEKFFKDFIIYLSKESLTNASPENIIISRIDCTASFLFSSPEEMQECLDFFTPPKIAQRKNGTSRYDTTLQFVSKYHMYKLYQKKEEMLKNRGCHYVSDELFNNYLERSSNILRFEHEFKSAQLKRFLGLKREGMLFLELFLSSDFYRNFDIIKDIKSLFGDWKKEFSVYSREQALELIDFSFSRQFRKYFSFLNKCFSCGIEVVKATMSKQLYSSYKRKLLSTGIDIEKLCFLLENKVELSYSDRNYFTKERIICFD